MKNLISVIETLKRISKMDGDIVEPCATDDAIQAFKISFYNFFEHAAPAEYIDFLRQMNGYEYNGLIIYGAQNSKTSVNSSPLNLIECNEIARDSIHPELKKIVLLGEDSTGILAYEFDRNEFQYRDRIGLDRVDPFESLADLLSDQIPKIEN